jgi:hypothetical protein
MTVADLVNHPPHYRGFSNGAQVIDIAEHLGFNRGCVVKYIARAGRKDGSREIEDLLKARWYLDREIARMTDTDEFATVPGTNPDACVAPEGAGHPRSTSQLFYAAQRWAKVCAAESPTQDCAAECDRDAADFADRAAQYEAAGD